MTSFERHPTVTIGRSYFDTLVRRAQFNSLPGDQPTGPLIGIPQVEYEELKKVARQYASLRQNLIKGGVTQDTIDLLSSSDESTWAQPQPFPATPSAVQDENAPVSNGTQYPSAIFQSGQESHQDDQYLDQSAQTVTAKHHNEGHYNSYQNQTHQHWAEPKPGLSQGNGHPNTGTQGFAGRDAGSPTKMQYERIATRTVLLFNLPEGTTHAHIASAVRGGQLLDIFLRAHDRSAQVSFLNAADAKAFYDHVRRHDLYIRQRRVNIRWSDRQYILPAHVAHKISAGATRNLAIRRCDPKHTEESLRDDLEHIHNLVVIRVTFVGSTCFISTNSVNSAMFARTCMMSRLKYKGSRIEWDADECAQPIPDVRLQKPQTQAAPTKPGLNPLANRFQLLDLDDDSDDDNGVDVTLGISTPGSVEMAA